MNKGKPKSSYWEEVESSSRVISWRSEETLEQFPKEQASINIDPT